MVSNNEGRISYKDGLVAALEAFKEAQNYAANLFVKRNAQLTLLEE